MANELSSGLDLTGRDAAVRPQDDFYQAWNGTWLNAFEIPDDKAQYASFTALHDEAEEQLHAIINELAADAGNEPDAQGPQSPATQVAILYADFMDEAGLEARGIATLTPLFEQIDQVTSAEQLPAMFGELNRIGVRSPIGIFVHQDNKDATRYLLDIRQSGLGLPDRDYYLDDKFADVLTAYNEHIATMLVLADLAEDDAAANDAAHRIVALEAEIAEISWDKVKNRDPEATYNLVDLEELEQLGGSMDLGSYLVAVKAKDLVETVNVGQPDYLTKLADVVEGADLQTWRDYLHWAVVGSFASLLGNTIDQANFAFYGTTLSGVPEQRERWKRAVSLVESAVGEALGQVYVSRHFPPQNKARMVALVDNLIAAYAEAIDDLDWMTDETKKAAHDKLKTFRPKIGYPDTWRDYSDLRLVAGDLFASVIAASEFEHDREMAKLPGPIDRDEWFMPPQMVNAYYNPEMNEIVFPAAILQPPFFTMTADDAVNYGAIGAVIGHEISHGFDDKGSQYDGLGNLRNWWTPEDAAAFTDKTSALSAQYAQYEPVEGHKLNGDLTLGENIADVSGLAVALRAYRRSLGGERAPVIDGLTGEQRFFAGWAQVWRAKTRDQEAIRRVASDPHSPPEHRVLGVLVNSDDFVAAFDVQPGDGMWVEPDQRVRIW